MAKVLYLSEEFDRVFVDETVKTLKKFLPEIEPMGYMIEDNSCITHIYGSYEESSKILIARRKKNTGGLISYLAKSCLLMKINNGIVHIGRIIGKIHFEVQNHKRSLKIEKECYKEPDYTEFDGLLRDTLQSVYKIYPKILKDVIDDLELKIAEEKKMNGEHIKEICFSYKGPPEYLESCFNALCKAGLFYELDFPLFKKIMNGKKTKEKMALNGTISLLKLFIHELRDRGVPIFTLGGKPNESFDKKLKRRVYYDAFAPFFTKDSEEITGFNLGKRAFKNEVTSKEKVLVERAVGHLVL